MIEIYDLGEWWELRGAVSIRRLGRQLYPGTHTIDRSSTQAVISIFCRQEVGRANADQYACRNISTKSSDSTTLVSCLPPRLVSGKNILRALHHYKRDIMYMHEGSRCLLKKTPSKRRSSKVCIVSFGQLRFKAWRLTFFSAKM